MSTSSCESTLKFAKSFSIFHSFRIDYTGWQHDCVGIVDIIFFLIYESYVWLMKYSALLILIATIIMIFFLLFYFLYKNVVCSQWGLGVIFIIFSENGLCFVSVVVLDVAWSGLRSKKKTYLVNILI